MRILIWNLFAIHLIRRTCGVISLLRFVSVCLCNVSWYFTTYYSRRLRVCVVKLCGYFWSYASAHFPSAPALSVSNSRRAHGHNSQYAFLWKNATEILWIFPLRITRVSCNTFAFTKQQRGCFSNIHAHKFIGGLIWFGKVGQMVNILLILIVVYWESFNLNIQIVFLFKFLINMKKKLKFLQKIVFFDNFSFFFLKFLANGK